MMVSADTDAEVIARSLADAERFELIFDRHAPSIHRYLRRRLGESLAAELTAETFTRAFRARDSFDTRQTSALPWLLGIAANLIKMQLRSDERRRRAYRRFDPRATESATTSDVNERLDARALGPALAAALTDLTHDEREVLLLNAWAGLSPAEIAHALSVSGAMVRKRLHRARTKAAEHLEHAYDTEEAR
jgi:RNA polymerase sigma-70 factor (ECF subfamily)